jgi:hypothetical protein
VATKSVFLGANGVRLGETSPISIPVRGLLLGQLMGADAATEVPQGYASIQSIALRYHRTGTGNLYLKFACSKIGTTAGSATEDADSYTVYIAGANDIESIPVPGTAFNGLSFSTGDVLTLAVYRDDSVATDTYSTDFDVIGFSVTFTTGAGSALGTGDRSKKILGKIQLAVTGSVDESAKLNLKIPEETIYDIMGDYAMKVAQETLCLENSSTLTIVNSTTTEPSGFLRLKLIELDENLSLPLVEIDLEDFDGLSRYDFAGTAQTPLYYKRWNGTITLNPDVATGSYPVYYWGVPTTTPSSTIDPETPAKFDKAIEYGTLSEVAMIIGRNDLAGVANIKYESEIGKIKINQWKTKSRMLQLQSHE